MLDVAVAYNRYKFLGHEFLTWLWFTMENSPQSISSASQQTMGLRMGNRIVLENRSHDVLESITITGDEAGLEEGLLALQKGALVSEINMAAKDNDQEFQFSIKGESFNLTQVKVPPTQAMETEDDLEGAVLEKIYLYDAVTKILENAYQRFINIRLSNDWDRVEAPRIQGWIYAQTN